MSKDRLEDTRGWLLQNAVAGKLGALRRGQVLEFADRVSKNDKTNNGAALSLDWSWYNSRPDKDARHAIRAYLLASLYNNDIAPKDAHAEAERVKTKAKNWLLAEISSRILAYLGDTDTRAVLYQVAAKGGGTQRATATCTRCDSNVGVELADRLGKGGNVGVVLIDMQGDLEKGGNIGQNTHYGGTPALEHQQDLLQIAAGLRAIVYDIVIDRDGAAEGGLTVQRQRSDSYAEAARIKTSPLLAQHFPGAQLRHIPKPSYPTFYGTLFAEHLAADGVDTVIVMGYDANTCVAETVFGNPAKIEQVPLRPVSDEEMRKYLDTHAGDLPLYARDPKALRWKIAGGSKIETTQPYTIGLLDSNIKVITSRAVLMCGSQMLRPEWGFLSEKATT